MNWHYFGARYYDAEIGRWLSVDPLASFEPNLSPYHYVRNNPALFIDKFGLSPRNNSFASQAMEEIQSEWDAVWSPAIGSPSGFNNWTGSTKSYLQNSGIWSKQYYGGGAGYEGTSNWAFGWMGFDWILDVTKWLTAWTNKRITESSILKANIPLYGWYYIYKNSRHRANWDFKDQIKDIPPGTIFRLQGQFVNRDDPGNIGWGRIMAAHGWDPIIAMMGAGIKQRLDKMKNPALPSHPPFGDDIRDTLMIARGYLWYWFGR